MKIYSLFLIIVIYGFISFPIYAENNYNNLSDDTIRSDESIEDYKKRINKKEDNIKTIKSIKVVGSKEREVYNGQYVITQEMIKNSGSISVADILAQQPSIYIQSDGDFGQLKSVKLNGSPAQHLLILLDGVKLDDPSNAQPFFDIGQIPLSFIEEIEIIKGPSSVLYGSGAIAGIINIKTKKYKENVTTIKQEIGSSNTLLTQAGSNINIKNLNISLFGNFYKTDGYSLASTPYIKGKDLEDDSSLVKDLNLKINYQFSEGTSIDSFFKISSSKADYDGFDTAPVDSEDNTVSKNENFYYFAYNFKLFSTFQNQLKFSQYSTKRKYEEIYSGSSKKTVSDYQAKEQLFGYKASYSNKDLLFIGGVDFETKRMNLEEQSINDLSFYGDIKEYINSRLSLEQGFRLDQNQRNISLKETKFSNDIAYNVGFAYDLNEMDAFIKLNIGQSYRQPSLYELFSDYGNSKLKPEVSKGINLEFSSNNFSKHVQQITFNMFFTNVDNMIYFVDSRYKNIGNYTNIGFDVAFPFYIDNFLYINDLKIIPTYSYITSKDRYTNNNSTLIPTHKLNTSFSLDITPKYHLNWNTALVSSTSTINNNKKVNLSGYFLNNAMFSVTLKNTSKLYLRVDNIFNEQYQTSYGYNTKDRSYYFGIVVDM